MGKAFLYGSGGGGGGGVSFTVKGGTTAPASPKVGTIWVNTDQDITGYTFSATEPESPVEGMVWFLTSKSSTVAFNALKKNALMVYPVSAKQWQSGAWVSKLVSSGTGTGWVSWFDGTIFDNGEQYDGVTGGWIHSEGDTIDKTLTGSCSSTTSFGSYCATVDKIDVTDFTTLNVNVTSLSGAITPAVGSTPDKYGLLKYEKLKDGAGVKTLDISDITGEVYIVILSGSGSGSYVADKVWLA